MKKIELNTIQEDFPYLDYDILATVDVDKDEVLINKIAYYIVDLMPLCKSCGYRGGGSGKWCKCLVQVMINLGLSPASAEQLYPAVIEISRNLMRKREEKERRVLIG